MKIKKLFLLVSALTSALILASCAGRGIARPQAGKSQTPVPEAPRSIVIKLGISGEEDLIWKYIKGELSKENIILEIISFSDYIIPNTALADGEIDVNAFQTEIFFNNFLEQSGADLSILCYTVLAPMGIYPGTSASVESLPDGAKIAIPNDPSNGGRALNLLQAAGLIKIDEKKGIFPTIKDITENPKEINIIEMAPALIPSVLDELAAAAVNNGVARNSGLSPLDDAIFIENAGWEYMKNYYNIIAVQTKDMERPEIKRIAELYQSEENRKNIEEEYKGSSIPAF